MPCLLVNDPFTITANYDTGAYSSEDDSHEPVPQQVRVDLVPPYPFKRSPTS